MFGRTVKASLAKDNGKSLEHMKRKEYPDKSKCFECGSSDGHLSYKCPVNVLGDRQREPARQKARKRPKSDGKNDSEEDVPNLVVDQSSSSGDVKKKVFRKNEYFSDEEDLSD
jgi:U11/U12 small nuclear ribonucleoprotein 31 kDa protein